MIKSGDQQMHQAKRKKKMWSENDCNNVDELV